MSSHGSNQAHNFMFTIKNIHNEIDYKKYDKILILRFDIIYKRGMKFWNIFHMKIDASLSETRCDNKSQKKS